MAIHDDPQALVRRVIVSRRCHEQDIRPRFVYRQAPMSTSDSGWSVLAGDESPEELDDPHALLSLPLGLLLDRWPELRPVLETDDPEGQWVWDDDRQQYVTLTDET